MGICIFTEAFFSSKTPPVVFFLWLPVQKKFALVRAAREEKIISRGFFKEVHCPANVMESCLSRAYQLCLVSVRNIHIHESREGEDEQNYKTRARWVVEKVVAGHL